MIENPFKYILHLKLTSEVQIYSFTNNLQHLSVQISFLKHG